MVGISFWIPTNNEKSIRSIFDKIPIENYLWNLKEDDIYNIPCLKENQFLFTKKVIEGTEFKNKINNKKYLVNFCNLQAFTNLKEIRMIDSFKDYINSNCQLIILITDGRLVQVYSKHEVHLIQIQENAEKSKFTHVKYIPEIEDVNQYITSF